MSLAKKDRKEKILGNTDIGRERMNVRVCTCVHMCMQVYVYKTLPEPCENTIPMSLAEKDRKERKFSASCCPFSTTLISGMPLPFFFKNR